MGMRLPAVSIAKIAQPDPVGRQVLDLIILQGAQTSQTSQVSKTRLPEQENLTHLFDSQIIPVMHATPDCMWRFGGALLRLLFRPPSRST